jgi:O-antigen ligase
VHYQPVVDRFPIPIPLDPIASVVFVAAFVACAIATVRRPAYGAAALLFIQPMAWYREAGTMITFPKILLLATFTGLLGHRATREALRERPLVATLIALGGILLATALSGLHAEHLDAVVRECFKTVEYAALVATMYVAYRLDPDDRLLVGAFTASATIVSLSALVQDFIGAPSGLWFQGHPIPRISGLIEGPNQLAGYLEVAIATLATWSIVRRNTLITIALFLSSVTMVLTFSRGGLIGASIVMLVLLALERRAMLRPAAVLLGGAVVGALGVGTLGAVATHETSVRASADLFRVTSTSSNYAGGVGNRSDLWGAALYFFKSHPIFGIGAGNFELELEKAGLYGVRTHANSWYLQSLAEGGIVLFGAVVAFVVTAITMLARAARRSPWTTAALAATIALALHQTFDFLYFYPKVGGPWMILIALGLAAAVRPREVCD